MGLSNNKTRVLYTAMFLLLKRTFPCNRLEFSEKNIQTMVLLLSFHYIAFGLISLKMVEQNTKKELKKRLQEMSFL